MYLYLSVLSDEPLMVLPLRVEFIVICILPVACSSSNRVNSTWAVAVEPAPVQVVSNDPPLDEMERFETVHCIEPFLCVC